jgi:hypothetical protein
MSRRKLDGVGNAMVMEHAAYHIPGYNFSHVVRKIDARTYGSSFAWLLRGIGRSLSGACCGRYSFHTGTQTQPIRVYHRTMVLLLHGDLVSTGTSVLGTQVPHEAALGCMQACHRFGFGSEDAGFGPVSHHHREACRSVPTTPRLRHQLEVPGLRLVSKKPLSFCCLVCASVDEADVARASLVFYGQTYFADHLLDHPPVVGLHGKWFSCVPERLLVPWVPHLVGRNVWEDGL